MTDRVHYHPNLIFSVGTQVVTLVDIPGSAGRRGRGVADRGRPRLHCSEYERMRNKFLQAHETSELPESPRESSALHDQLVRLRCATANQE